MPKLSHFIREQDTSTVAEYRKHVYRLAGVYASLVLVTSAANVLILFKGKFFITLAQRSNIETLTLAVVFALFAYLAIVSLPGAWGALKIVRYNLPTWMGRDKKQVEARKQAAVGKRDGQPDAVYLNCLVRRQGSADAPIEVPIADEAGELGKIVIDGARVTHEQSPCRSSNSLFAYFEQRLEKLAQAHDPQAQVEIVQWATIDDESALQYGSMVTFSRNLERHLGSGPLWPCVELTDEDVHTLTGEATELCPVLRDEAHLPDLEYEAEHRLPIIPEPLAFISLSRQEQRADPLASMGCALIIAVVILTLIIYYIFMPPWVPSK